MCVQDLNVSWFWNWTLQVRHKGTWMGATQYSKSHDRTMHRFTSPKAWHHCVTVCFILTHIISAETIHFEVGWTTHNGVNGMPIISTKARIRIKCEQYEAWHHCCLCWKTTHGLSNPLYLCSIDVQNSVSTISMSALYKHRDSLIHTL